MITLYSQERKETQHADISIRYLFHLSGSNPRGWPLPPVTSAAPCRWKTLGSYSFLLQFLFFLRVAKHTVSSSSYSSSTTFFFFHFASPLCSWCPWSFHSSHYFSSHTTNRPLLTLTLLYFFFITPSPSVLLFISSSAASSSAISERLSIGFSSSTFVQL